MKKLGISIYSNHSVVEEDQQYIQLAHQYGFNPIFTCLLSVEGDKDRILSNFKKTIAYAKELGMEVICDISPRIFQALEISYDDLSFFHDLGRWDTFRSWLYW